MEPVKTGQILRCQTCGVELKVIKDCDSTCLCNIVCCDRPMTLDDSSGQDES
ncbi:MAG: hypothetical protein ACYS30_24350 [Planctomycetota bacterium]